MKSCLKKKSGGSGVERQWHSQECWICEGPFLSHLPSSRQLLLCAGVLSQHADVRQVAGEVGGWKLAGGHTESSDEAKPPSLLLDSQNQAQPVVPEALRP